MNRSCQELVVLGVVEVLVVVLVVEEVFLIAM